MTRKEDACSAAIYKLTTWFFRKKLRKARRCQWELIHNEKPANTDKP
jgi:hypothetical protein